LENTLNAIKALADRHRVRALLALPGQELCLCNLQDLLGLVPSSVSRHMSILQEAGFRRFQGRKASGPTSAWHRWRGTPPAQAFSAGSWKAWKTIRQRSPTANSSGN
jgi:Predicted transcriptional regulators